MLDAATDEVLAERSEAIGTATNNVAEYRGLIAGLAAARELGARQVAVRMDSKLVVEQMSGRWRIKHPDMRPLAAEAAELAAGFDDVTYEWVPRARNARADRLANEAMDRAGASPTTAGNWVPPSGPATRLMLVRHGATAHSAQRRFSGHNGLPLDAVGQEQALALAERSAHFAGGLAAVVASPLVRARQTAEVIGSRVGLPVRILDDLAETDFGAFEGLTAAEASARYPEEFAAWMSAPDAAPPDGESFAEVARRVGRAREQLLADYPQQTVVVVTHVTPIKTLIRLVLGAPPAALFRIHLDTASISAVDYFTDNSASVRLVNDTGHLARPDE